MRANEVKVEPEAKATLLWQTRLVAETRSGTAPMEVLQRIRSPCGNFLSLLCSRYATQGLRKS